MFVIIKGTQDMVEDNRCWEEYRSQRIGGLDTLEVTKSLQSI